MGTEIPTLDLHKVQATVGRDANSLPTLVITDGTTEVVLGGGEDSETRAGMRRVSEAIWDWQLLIGARRHAEARLASLEQQHGIDPPGPITVTYIEPGVSEASTAYADADDEARIQELRGPSPSVSGAY